MCGSVREGERERERILLMVDVCVYNGNNVERERVRDRNGDYNLYSFCIFTCHHVVTIQATPV